jgi:hypothetical protein
MHRAASARCHERRKNFSAEITIATPAQPK